MDARVIVSEGATSLFLVFNFANREMINNVGGVLLLSRSSMSRSAALQASLQPKTS